MKSEEKDKWQCEQRKIAEQVQVLPDEHTSPTRFSRIFLCSNAAESDNNRNDLNTCSSYVGGVDVSYSSTTSSAIAVYIILQTPSLQVVYEDSECFDVEQSYLPSFLAFRELAPLQRLVQKQTTEYKEWTPSVILVDGNGILHPRQAGLASALGVATGLPTVGIGKTLYQEGSLTKDVVWSGIDTSLKDATDCFALFEKEDEKNVAEKNDYWIRDNKWISGEQKHSEETVKTRSSRERRQMIEQLVTLSVSYNQSKRPEPKLRGLAIPLYVPQRGILACAVLAHGQRQHPTQTPIFVSVGHLISLEKATQWVVALSVYSRIPEPLRQADLRGRALLRLNERSNMTTCRLST